MTDNSKIILNWEIDNVAGTFATERAESGVFNEGGFKWTIEARRGLNGYTKFILRCDPDHNGPWKCDVKVDMFKLAECADLIYPDKPRHCFDENSSIWRYQSDMWWNHIEAYSQDGDKIKLEMQLLIISREGGEPETSTMFDAPNRLSNVILKIGDKKLHVSKEILGIHSPVFDTMFFGNFAEKGKEEVEIKDVVYEEFINLLNLIYIGTLKITDRTVLHLLKLADEFQMERVLDQSKMHLMESKGFDVMKKLLLADQYRLESLKDHCLQTFNSSSELVGKIESSPDYDKFSDRMKAAICDRIKNLGVV